MIHRALRAVGPYLPRAYLGFIRHEIRTLTTDPVNGYPSYEVGVLLGEWAHHLDLGDIDLLKWHNEELTLYYLVAEELCLEWRRLISIIKSGEHYVLKNKEALTRTTLKDWVKDSRGHSHASYFLTLRDLVAEGGLLIESEPTYKESGKSRHLFRLIKDTVTIMELLMKIQGKK